MSDAKRSIIELRSIVKNLNEEVVTNRRKLAEYTDLFNKERILNSRLSNLQKAIYALMSSVVKPHDEATAQRQLGIIRQDLEWYAEAEVQKATKKTSK